MLLFLVFVLATSPPDYDADALAAIAIARAKRDRDVVVVPPSVDPAPPNRRTDSGDSGDAAPTPHDEVARVLSLLPKPVVGFVDFGCGKDARWCVAAAEKWGCRVTGVEIDPVRARWAKDYVNNAGLGHLITIIEGDATTTDVQADVGVVYLWPEVLEKLKTRLEKLTAFASYQHQPQVAGATKNGDSWIWTKPQPVATVPTATWGGRQYTGPLCNSSRCEMCNAIRQSLAAQQAQATPAATVQSSGHYVKHCSNGKCWYEWVQDN